jgi:branched-chain amino acid transport system substrate-binding protein
MTRSAALAVILLLAACTRGPAPEVRVGVMATFTGPFAEVSGVPTRRGAALALRAAGDTVTIGGRVHRVLLVERGFDDRADAAAGAARALINQERVVAIIGPQFSRHAIPVGVMAEQARIPMISPMSSNPATTAGRRFVFRLAFLDDVQAPVLARFARDTLGARTAAVFYDVTGSYSRDLATEFRRAFEEDGGRVTAFETYTADRVEDVGPQVARIAAARADVVFLPGFPDALARHVPLLQRAGVRATLLGGDSWDPQSLPALRPRQRAFVTAQWRPDLPTDEARRFREAYLAAFGTEPRAAAAMTFDAVRILLDGLRRAGTTEADALRDAIAATDGYRGASGTVTFRGRTDPGRQVAISEVQNGVLVTRMLVGP